MMKKIKSRVNVKGVNIKTVIRINGIGSKASQIERWGDLRRIGRSRRNQVSKIVIHYRDLRQLIRVGALWLAEGSFSNKITGLLWLVVSKRCASLVLEGSSDPALYLSV